MFRAHKRITANALENWSEVKKTMKLSLYQEKKAIAIKLLKQGAALDFITRATYITRTELLRHIQKTS